MRGKDTAHRRRLGASVRESPAPIEGRKVEVFWAVRIVSEFVGAGSSGPPFPLTLTCCGYCQWSPARDAIGSRRSSRLQRGSRVWYGGCVLSDLHQCVLGFILTAELTDAETVAEQLGLSVEVVRRLFDELEQEGMIAPAPMQ